MWLVMHHFVWDGYETRPHEEVDPNGIFEMLTDPDLVSRNIVANLYMSAGMTIMMSVAMALPMLIASYYNSYDDTGRRSEDKVAPKTALNTALGPNSTSAFSTESCMNLQYFYALSSGTFEYSKTFISQLN